MAHQFRKVGTILNKRSPFLSYARIAASVALVSTALMEAIGILHSAQAEIGTGVALGVAAATVAKILHIA